MRQRAAFFYAWAECGISARFFVIIYIMVHSKRILAFCISGGIFTLIAGTLGHFVYEWSGGAVWTAWLFPVNESVWEHLKLLILPAVVFFALGAYFMRGANNYISALFFCIAVSAGFVTGAFYLYTSVIGHSVLAMVSAPDAHLPCGAYNNARVLFHVHFFSAAQLFIPHPGRHFRHCPRH